MGWPNGKIKEVIPGPHASIRTGGEANPDFYFYFDDKAAGLGHCAIVSNPNQYALLKLDLYKIEPRNQYRKIRRLRFIERRGPECDDRIQVPAHPPGLYKVTMGAPLQPGEYCFLSGGAGAVDVFDFGVDQNQ